MITLDLTLTITCSEPRFKNLRILIKSEMKKISTGAIIINNNQKRKRASPKGPPNQEVRPKIANRVRIKTATIVQTIKKFLKKSVACSTKKLFGSARPFLICRFMKNNWKIFILEPLAGIEPATYSLPWECSTSPRQSR